MAVTSQLRAGAVLFALAAIVLGASGLIFGEFATAWQPIQAFGNVPYSTALAYVAACGLTLGGVALLWPRTTKLGAALLTLVYAAFSIFWLPRVIGFPKLFGTWGGFLQEFALLVGALVILAAGSSPRTMRLLRILFGICVLSFAFEHFTALAQTASLVPAWIPGSKTFWAVATGVCFLLAGIAILAQFHDLLATRLLAAMLIAFGILIWLPALFAYPHVHSAWAGNGVNLAAAAAAWIVADSMKGSDYR